MNEQEEHQPGNWREAGRFQAWELWQKDWKQKDIAEALSVSEGAVSQWLKIARGEGAEALRHRKGGGPKPRLTDEQVGQLPRLLDERAEAWGFRGEVWTRAHVAQVIKQQFSLQFSRSHVGRLLQQIGWSRQELIECASQRDEEVIVLWRCEKW